MVNSARKRRDSSASPREKGEIDTRSPFQSVRAAMSLFGETVTSPRSSSIKKSKPELEGVLDKEAEFHFAQKELGRCKSEVKNAETAANKALPELENAMKTLLELKDKIKAVNASKDSITEETEELRIRVKELEQAKSSKQDRKGKTGNEDDLDDCRKGYRAAATELDAAKQELSRLHRDFDAAMDVKLIAIQMAEEAEIAAKGHSDKVFKLKKEIESMKESLDRVNLTTRAILDEQVKVLDEKDKEEGALRTAKGEVEMKLRDRGQEKESGELKLAEMNNEIAGLKVKIEQAKATLSESERNAYSELNAAREAFRQVERENQSLQEEVVAIRRELAEVGKEIAETRENLARERALEDRLRVELRGQKLENETANGSKVQDTDAFREMTTKLEKLLTEAKQAKEEEQEMSRSSEELKREAKKARETEMKLAMAMKEAEEAKAAERKAQNELKIVSERKGAESATASADRDRKKKLSKEEYEAMKEKGSEPEKFAEVKLASAMAELEALRASENAAERNLNESLKEIEEVARATEEAFKEAEMADTSKISMQRELRRHREEQSCS